MCVCVCVYRERELNAALLHGPREPAAAVGPTRQRLSANDFSVHVVCACVRARVRACAGGAMDLLTQLLVLAQVEPETLRLRLVFGPQHAAWGGGMRGGGSAAPSRTHGVLLLHRALRRGGSEGAR